MTAHAGFGSRCLAQDALGNRCFKGFTHMESVHGTERWHDASHGSADRRWL